MKVCCKLQEVQSVPGLLSGIVDIIESNKYLGVQIDSELKW